MATTTTPAKKRKAAEMETAPMLAAGGAREEEDDTKIMETPPSGARREEDDTLRRENQQLKCFVQTLFTTAKVDLGLLPPDFRTEITEAEPQYFLYRVIEDETFDWETDLPQKWKDDVEFICAVIRYNPFRVKCKKAPTQWKDLPYHLITNEKVLVHALSSNIGGLFWDEGVPHWMRDNPQVIYAAYKSEKLRVVPDDLKRSHREIALLAIKRGSIEADECTCFDEAFFQETIESGRLKWSQLPQNLKTSLDFAKNIAKFPSESMVKEMLQNVPALRQDVSFWRHFFVSTADIGFGSNLKEFVPPQHLSNADFMLEMCSKNLFVIRMASPSLKTDKAFWEALLAQNVEALRWMPHSTQVMFPELVCDAIPFIPRSGEYEESLDPSFWENHDFVLAWFSAGLGCPFENGPDPMTLCSGDEDMILLFLKRETISGWELPRELLNDRDFVLKAVSVQPRLFSSRNIDPQLRSDHFVFAKFAAQSFKLTNDFVLDMHLRGDDDTIQNHLAFIRLELNKYNSFFTFVCGASVSSSESTLPMLNQGPETFMRFKKLLVEFLEVPTREWLLDLQNAEQNMCRAMHPWAPNA